MTTLLVIDDDADIREALQEILEEDAYRVCTVENAKEALRMLTEEGFRPDVILLDMMMPEMSGKDFLQAKSNFSDLVSIPVIIVSAANVNFSRYSASESDNGVVLILQKPFSVEQLLRVLAHARNSTRPPPHPNRISSIPPQSKVPKIE